ncbi:MAG: long-chain-fatty-acid--CoA ligase [Myxococcales bacterium]|nr:long-chain-fatty-acid--CoA ligase [Myxococcales bacterium]
MRFIDGVETLAELPEVVARTHADKDAVIVGEQRLTYAQLVGASRDAARALQVDGVGAGDRVCALGKGAVESVVLMFAAAKLGACYVPISSRLAPPEVAYVLGHAGPKVLFVEAAFASLLERALDGVEQRPRIISTGEASGAESFDSFCGASDGSPLTRASAPDADAVVVMLYTSGTTGHPKAVRLSSRSLLALGWALRDAGDGWFGWDENMVSMVSQPSFHIGGVWWLTQGLAQGCTNVLLRGFEPSEVLPTIERHRVATTCMAPAMMRLLLLEPGCATTDFSSLRTIAYGGSTCPTDLLQQAMQVFGCGFCNAYGMTETGNVVVSLRPDEHRQQDPQRLKSVGKPLPGVEVRILGEDGAEVPPGATGELTVRSRTNMVDYWRQPEATSATVVDGWLKTGDAGYRDDEGYLYVSDRIRDMIICAGEKVFPAEIESAIRTHPDVSDAAVVGIPDRLWGEAVHALVVATADSRPKPLEIVRHVRGQVAAFKVPKSVELVDELPRNASGKILRRELRRPYWAGHDRLI